MLTLIILAVLAAVAVAVAAITPRVGDAVLIVFEPAQRPAGISLRRSDHAQIVRMRQGDIDIDGRISRWTVQRGDLAWNGWRRWRMTVDIGEE